MLVNVLNRSHDAYLEHGSRSTKKLNVLHEYIARNIAAELIDDQSILLAGRAFPFKQLASKGYELMTKTENGKGNEKKLACGIDNQDIDIYVKNTASGVEGSVEAKFPLRNMQQNRKNNLLNILGITSLMETCGGADSVYHAAALFYPVNAPYFTTGNVFDHQESFDAKQAVDEWNQLFTEHPNLAPYCLSLVFYEFVVGNPSDVAGSFESGDVSVKLYDVSNVMKDMELHPCLFINDFDGFCQHFAASLSTITKTDLLVDRSRRLFYSGARKRIGEDVFDNMSEQERKDELIKLISDNSFSFSSSPTI